jgi:hypothetical protein
MHIMVHFLNMHMVENTKSEMTKSQALRSVNVRATGLSIDYGNGPKCLVQVRTAIRANYGILESRELSYMSRPAAPAQYARANTTF